MNVGRAERSVMSPTAATPVPSVNNTAALRRTASRALASAVAGDDA